MSLFDDRRASRARKPTSRMAESLEQDKDAEAIFEEGPAPVKKQRAEVVKPKAPPRPVCANYYLVYCTSTVLAFCSNCSKLVCSDCKNSIPSRGVERPCAKCEKNTCPSCSGSVCKDCNKIWCKLCQDTEKPGCGPCQSESKLIKCKDCCSLHDEDN